MYLVRIPGADRLATACDDGAVRIYPRSLDPGATRIPTLTLRRKGNASALAASPDGTALMAYRNDDEPLAIWRIAAPPRLTPLVRAR